MLQNSLDKELLNSILQFTFNINQNVGSRTKFKQGKNITNSRQKLGGGHTLSCCICTFIWLPSFEVTEQAMTGLETPHARPRACFEGTNTYGTFCQIQIE